MKFCTLILLTFILAVDPATVKKINSAKSAAEDAFKKGDYTTAIRHYEYLVDSLGVNEDEVILNLANSYYLAKDTTNAVSRYQAVTGSPQPDIKSKAFQQLGVMANQQGHTEQALNHFKEAIKAELSNDDARYNYEMLKKKLEEEKKQQQEKQEDQKGEDDQKKEKKDKEEGEKQDEPQKEESEEQKGEKPSEQQEETESKDKQNVDRDKLDEMKISEEKARMILEAMKNQEKQYLQQQKRKPTQSRDRNKPDW